MMIAVSLLWAGCSTTSVTMEQDVTDEADPPDYTLLFYIHGDADYLFHYGDGTPALADRRALQKAQQVAGEAVSGEVLIFHQQPKRRAFLFFPRNTSRLYHYRGGEKIREVSYNQQAGEAFLSREATLFHQFSTGDVSDGHPFYFLLFGHEIPQEEREGYHRSRPGIAVGAASLVAGMKEFLGDSREAFDLAVLSTCSNGTPAMARHLYPVADYLLASPQTLHLSYIDPDGLIKLEEEPGISAAAVAEEMARQSYDRLSQAIHTVVSLSLYDLKTVQNYIDELYEHNRIYEEIRYTGLFRDNRDCALRPFFDPDEHTAGITVFYRPPRFGSASGTETHSGWGCRGL
jgi:hypothetical protein